MKRVAVVGYGFMGRTHYGAWRRTRGAKVVAVCDSNLSQLAAKVTGNIADVADNTPLPKSIRVYDDFDKMLEAGGFEIVDITLPTMLHKECVVKAVKAGYHVLCEKPMALSAKDGRAMIAAARKADRKLMVAHVVRFQAASLYLKNLVQTRKYGKVIAAEFSRFIAPPKWSPKGADWFFDEKKSGGVYLDAHIHDIDLMLSVFGCPQGVVAAVRRRSDGYPDHTSAIYSYPGFIVTTTCSFAASQSLLFDSAYRVFFEKATVFCGARYQGGMVTVYPEKGKPFSPKTADKAKAYADEVRYFLDYVEGRNDGMYMSMKSACDSVALAEAERSAALGSWQKLSFKNLEVR